MLNRVQIIGNLGADPEIRHTNDNKKIANLSVAVTDTWKDKQTGEKKSKTEWIRCSIFNDGLSNVCENYLKKGSKVYIEGKMQTRKWTDSNGNDKYSTEVVLQNFDGKLIMLDSRPESAGAKQESGWEAPSSADLDDSIPF